MPRAKLLVIEDDPLLAEMMTEILTRAGYAVRCVWTLAAARRALREERFDLVLSDCVLPDGLACVLFDAYLRTPTLLVTAYRDPEHLQLVARHPSFVGLLAKPFAPHALLERVKEVLTRCDTTVSSASPASSSSCCWWGVGC